MAGKSNFKVHSSLIIGVNIDSTISKAVAASAKNGKRTVIITPRQITKLKDQTLREMRRSHRALRRIIFLTPASRKDLLRVVSDLYTWDDNVPHQLFLEGVLHNLKSPEIVCAVAIDSARACSRVSKAPFQLVVSVNEDYYLRCPDTVNFLAANYFDDLVSLLKSDAVISQNK